ncbi:hypothetical protein DEA98_09825 [Brucella pseudogrignonensis]|nr:hypothetical protein [Brucella pseudogrignonensis]
MSLVSAQWMPAVSMKRIICHWTAGTNTANATDKKAYHLLIEGDGTVVRGNASIADNSGSLKDGYAAHTLNCNTDSIGVSMCAMAGAVESPFKPWRLPDHERTVGGVHQGRRRAGCLLQDRSHEQDHPVSCGSAGQSRHYAEE